jgi:ABC-type glycerol-3-phosphate transport system substrate-binding protein
MLSVSDEQRDLSPGSGGLPHGPGWYAVLPEDHAAEPATPLTGDELRQRMGKRIRLMPDTGVFPLWGAGGGLTNVDAREVLGLDDDLVDELSQWGQEADYTFLPPDWDERGVELLHRLQQALGPDYEVVFIPG